uniref:ABC transporter domain-containing protein n=1 Tax=Parascaris equorum TaxID=6256 RepID=A0A914RIA3_PAREQ
MVTNELSFLKYADNIIVLANGEIVAEGNYRELTANGAFKQILEECENERRELTRKLAAEEVLKSVPGGGRRPIAVNEFRRQDVVYRRSESIWLSSLLSAHYTVAVLNQIFLMKDPVHITLRLGGTQIYFHTSSKFAFTILPVVFSCWEARICQPYQECCHAIAILPPVRCVDGNVPWRNMS